MVGKPLKEIDGIPVKDATRPLVLHVTQDDIKGSKRKKPEGCAIARACYRQLDVVEARIHLSRTYLRTTNRVWLRYETPVNARSELVAFDRGGKFSPIDVHLKPIAPSQRFGYRPTLPVTRDGSRPQRRKMQVIKDVRAHA